MSEPEFFEVWVVGMRFANKTAKDVTKEDIIVLGREPTNPHDPNAIMVLNEEGDVLGHVSRDSQKHVPSSLGDKAIPYVVHTAYAETEKAVHLILVNKYDPFA